MDASWRLIGRFEVGAPTSTNYGSRVVDDVPNHCNERGHLPIMT